MCRDKRLILISTLAVLIGFLGPAARAQPVKTGLTFWLDASKTSSLVLSGEKVSRWNDLSGNNHYADQTAEAQQPTYVRGAFSGKPIVDFGDSAYGNPLSPHRAWMQFRNAAGAVLNISNVRTVFWVSGMDAGSNGFLLGDDNNYHFHRGTANQFWDGANGWAHANIRTGSTYLNGKKIDGTATALPTDYSIISLVTAGNVETSMLTRDRTYRSGGIKLGELLIYDRPLTDDERISMENYLYSKWFVSGAASEPQPADGGTDVLREANLGWTAGEFAATHDVYFGTNFADVNDASRAKPLGVLVSEGQVDTTFNLDRLEFGQVYYWRVDEVNAAPDYTIYKGSVWSFTVEPYSYPIPGAAIAVTASSSQASAVAQNTINGSGLNADDQHSVDLTTMWMTSAGLPAWIQYAFDKPYMLDKLLVWNSNQVIENFIGFGAKNVIIEYSDDGQTWTPLAGVSELAQANGTPTYTANTTIDFGGVRAQYVRLTINSNWGGLTAQSGLSEVRFFSVPVTAWEPSPVSGAVNVAPETTLSWRAGRQAASHQIFVGTDAGSLSLAGTVSEPAYEADLNLDTTYFWKVVEVNQAEAIAEWESDTWTFSTVKALVVDDFESYTDNMDTGGAIFQTWIDGYEVAANGSIVGYPQAPFAERAIVQNGRQAMPVFYDNSGGATYSEAQRTFDAPQDWTKHGYKALSLAFYGDPGNTGQMYLKINNTKVPYNGKAEDLKRTQWLPWNIDLAATGANLKSVTKLAIGIDGAGAAGTLYLDDIQLQGSAPGFITPVDPGTTELLAWYKFDGDLKDAMGKNHGTGVGDATTTNDPVRGQVLTLDGIGDAVRVPMLAPTTSTLTIAMWVNTTVDPLPIQFASFYNGDGWAAGDLHWRYSYGKVNGGINGVAGGDFNGKSIVKADQWNHVAVTVSATEVAVWLNGYQEVSRPLTAVPTVILGEGHIGAWLNGTSIERPFTGKIDDARFYNRTLSQAEIAFLAGHTGSFPKPF